MRIYDREGELNKLSSQPVLESKINIRVRGNSSRTFDKVGYLFKFTDDAGRNANWKSWVWKRTAHGCFTGLIWIKH